MTTAGIKVFWDIETTGFGYKTGDRIVELAAIEYLNGEPTGKEFYSLIDPERQIPAEVVAIHGITNEKVRGAPRFKDVVKEFIAFIEGKELIAHNGKSFDEPFTNHEMAQAGVATTLWEGPSRTTDTLAIAKAMFPRQKVNLDALCTRYEIDLSQRKAEGHNARLDCHLLAKVYYKLTEGREADLSMTDHEADVQRAPIVFLERAHRGPQVRLTAADEQAHEAYVEALGPNAVERQAPSRRPSLSPR